MHPEWPLILFTFFLCLAGGTFTVQGLLTLLGKGRKMQLVSLIVSFASLVVGGIAVFMHLEHWERIFNGFGHITSGITLEFIGCIVFALALVVYFLMMRRSEDAATPKWCGAIAIVVGLALPAVTGMSYLMASLPSWDTPLLVFYYIANTVFMGGLAALVIAAATKDESATSTLSMVAIAGALLQLIVVLIYAFTIYGSADLYSARIQYYFDPTLPDQAMVDRTEVVQSIIVGDLAPMFWGAVIAVGAVLPLALTVLARKLEAGKKLLSYAGAALVCTMVGGICWRVILYLVAISVFALY